MVSVDDTASEKLEKLICFAYYNLLILQLFKAEQNLLPLFKKKEVKNVEKQISNELFRNILKDDSNLSS